MKHLFGFAILFLFSTIAFGQSSLKAPKSAPPADDGTSLFRGLFHYHGIRPIDDALMHLKGNRDTIVVILGPPRNVSRWVSELVSTTLADGGSVLVATDAGSEFNELFAGREPIRMIAGPVSCESPLDCLGGKESFPLITGRWAPFVRQYGELLRIATNGPGMLRLEGQSKYLQDFTEGFSGACRRGDRYLSDKELFAAGGTGPDSNPFRCLVLADQKVFSNQLLYASASVYANGVTPDNFGFANEVVKWLTADGTRKKCVFVENGQLQKRFDEFDFTSISPTNLPPDMPMPPIPNPLERPIQEGLAKTIDNGLARVEDNNRLNSIFTDDNRIYGWILGVGLLLLLSICLVLFAFRTWQSRHKASFQPLPVDALMLGGDAPLGSFEHRRLELLRGGDFRAPVVAYLRRLFKERGINAETAGRVPPPLDIRARNHREMKSMIRELWEEAFVFDREPLPYTRWKEIEQTLAAVRAAADADLWQFRSDQTG